MNKKELVETILEIKKVDTRTNLMKKKNEVLEGILEGLQVSDKNEEVEKTTTKELKQEVPKKKSIDRDLMVSCRNLTSGRLTYISKKTGLETVWSEFGDEEYVDVAELLTMKTSQPKFLKEPWLFIDDEDVSEYLGLKELYKNIIPIDEVDDFFSLSANEARKIVPKLPKGTKQLIGEKARIGITDGTLNNLQLVKLLEQELKLDLISLME
ncbi:hypothetical protein [Aquibacillus saliphilus]|uniref:hypothetical protein n=1 Tax=Aquibacillus saliphilus TaxID=1909422 RepID=UPI001CEFE547|nr:hypothetical protein [Aquibacillus saliphilus]